MIDTPGHVDFSSEVSTAARLVDGALVLVDAVEGVSSQTISVLRQAWDDRLKPILVVNKIDRLATELRMSPIEAYHHLAQLLEAANAVMGSFFAAERMEDDLRWREAREQRLAEKKAALEKEIAEHDLVISLVPYIYHVNVIKAAIKGKTNVVTTSYISPGIRELEDEIKKAGIVVMNEIGLDPGVDHLYAIKTIDEVHEKGGKVGIC